MDKNPFDQFDDAVADGPVMTPAGPDARRAVAPPLSERFRRNMEQGFYSGTLLGASIGAGAQDMKAGALADYDDLPQWETPLEGLVALAGQLSGAALSPENYVPLGIGARVVGASVRSPAVTARFAAGAIDAGMANAAIDAGIQGIEMGAGQRDGFDPVQFGASVALGAGIGGTAQAALGGPRTLAPDEPFDLEAVPDLPRPFPAMDAPPPAVSPAPRPAMTMGGEATAAPLLGETLDAQARAARGLGPSTVERGQADAVVRPALADAATAADAPPPPAGAPAGTFMFDPRELEVDAARFQFKSGGDEKGVIETLKRVQSWLPERGNQLIVWQDRAGRFFVVDGHQRTGLARRLLAEGRESDIRIPGVLYREADGVSAAAAMRTAALKNIAEGNANPIDGAKIIRDGGKDALKDMPMSKDAVRTAADLAKLGDEAFGMVVNEVVPANYARFVGQLIDDPARQKAALDALARFQPDNEGQAAALVRRVVDADMVTAEGTQGDMFGVTPESTVFEEVRIVDAAMRTLRTDAKLYARVFREAERIERTGSKVAREETADAATRAARDAMMVEKQAYRAGPVRDTLKQLAIEVKNGRRTLAEAKGDFLDALARAESRSGPAGADAGARSGPGDAAADPAGRAAGDAGDAGDAGQALTPEDEGQEILFSLGNEDAVRGLADGRLRRDLEGVAGMTADPAFVRVQDIAQQLSDALEAVAVRTGRITMRRARGSYNRVSGVIRIRTPDNFDTLAHELGHHVEINIGKPIQDLMKQHEAKLKTLAYAGAPKNALAKEGFAEFMRLMITNPAAAARAVPEFDAALRGMLARDYPDVLAAIGEGARAWRAWLEQPSADAVASTIVSGVRKTKLQAGREQLKRSGLADTISERLHTWYANYVDTFSPMSKAVRALARTYKDNTGRLLNLEAIDDPAKLLRMGSNSHQTALADLYDGVTPYKDAGSGPASASFRDALVTALGQPNALSRWDDTMYQRFGAYLWSRRALGEWQRFDQGLIPNKPDKLTRGDHVQTVAELEAAFPQFKAAADMIYDYQRGLWTKALHAGLITPEQFADGNRIVDYVPGHRTFDADGDPSPGGGTNSGKSSIVKQFRGSNRDVINPLDSIMAWTFELHDEIVRNSAARALRTLARNAGPGGGAIAEQIPARQAMPQVVDWLEAVEKAARDAGQSPADTATLSAALQSLLGNDKVTMFRSGVINEKGEPILFFREQGQLQALRLADGELGREMMALFNGLPPPQAQFLVETMAASAGLARLTVTIDPVFQVKNLFRDLLQSMIFYGKPFERLANVGRGLKDELLQREAAKQYNAAGGTMGGVFSATAYDARATADVNRIRAAGWNVRDITFKHWIQVSELTETANRVGLFRTFKEEAMARGLDENAAVFEAAFRARDHADFSRHGNRMMAIGRMIPFLRAAVVSTDKIARTMFVPLAREALTAEDQRARTMAIGAWARLSGALTVWLSIHALMADDEMYREAQSLRANHFVFRFGDTFYAIPKPYDTAVFFNSAEALYDAWVKDDPRAGQAWLDALYRTTLPPDLLSGNPILKTAIEMRTGTDARTGRDIVPDSIAGFAPELQALENTSAVAVALGKATGMPPVWIDQLIGNQFTTTGRSALSLYDYAFADKPMPGWDDTVLVSGFIKDTSRGATSTRAFWDLVGQRNGALETARRTWENLNDAGNTAAAEDFLATQDSPTRLWIAAGALDADVRRIHPLARAQNSVKAITDLRRDIYAEKIDTAAGPVTVNRRIRGQVDDILSQLAMAEARNGLVLAGVPGYGGRKLLETATWYRELDALSPDLARALADRYATAKVLPLDVVEKLWPQLESRLKAEGSAARAGDLKARAKAAGFEMGGTAMKRKPRARVSGDQMAPAL